MKSAITTLLFLLGLAITGRATALEGLFWDPDFAGEGWAIESQNDLAFWTWYTYDEDGQPTFRTALADVAISVDPLGNIIIDMAGSLFETQNRTETSEVGPFTARFQSIAGQLIGDINAAGQRRSLEPFRYNFVNEIDMLQGYWAITTLDPDEPTGATVFTLRFSPEQIELDDGTPAKEFETFDGRPGVIFYDPGLALFVGSADNGDGTATMFSFQGSDRRSFGTTVTTDMQGQPQSEFLLIYANALANTTQEAGAVEELFPFFPFAGKRVGDDLASPKWIARLRALAAESLAVRGGQGSR